MALLGSLIGNAMSDNPQSMGDVASNYFNNRFNQDMSQYLGVNANLTPQSTTINYNDQGQPDTVTTRHSVGEPDTSMNYNLAPPAAAPGQGIQNLGQVAPGQGVQMPPQMAQPQAQTQPTFNVGGAAPVTEQPAAPTAPVPAPSAQAVPGQEAVNQVNATQLPQPGPGVQVATAPGGAMPVTTPATAPQPAQPPASVATTPDWHNQLVQNTDNFTGLTALLAQPGTPDDVKDEAKDRLFNLMKVEQIKNNATKTIDGAAAGNRKEVNELARELASNKEGGSYVKAILFARLGLNQLAADEQQKLGGGAKYSSYMDADGNHFTVKLGGDGSVQKAFDQNGTVVDADKLANLNANYLSMKGAATGQTMGFDKIGNVISHTVVPGTGRVIWKDETSGKILTAAPEGYHTGKNQQEMLANSSYLQSRRADETKNRNELAAGRAPLFTDEQIEERASANRNRILGLPTTTYGGGGEGGINPTPTPAASTGLSQNILSKVISGARSTPQQQALYQQSVDAGTPGTLPNGNPVARPGTSQHETGNALDIDAKKLSTQDRRELAQNGWFQPLPNDPNHWERITPAAAGAAPQLGAGNPTVRDVQRSNAQAIANYEAPPLKGGGMNSQNATTMALVRQLNPDYDSTKYDVIAKARKDFSTGKQGDVVRTMNVSIDHLDTLGEAGKALQNSNVQVFNKIANEYAKQVGAPAPTNFDAIKTLVGSEVAKAIAGGATALGDREEIRKEIDSANSPQQLTGVIDKYQKLLGGQLKGLRTQYQDAGLKDFDKKLAARTKKVLGTGEESTNTNTNTRGNW